VPIEQFPVGQRMEVTYPAFAVSLTLHSETRMTFEIKEGPYARTETVDIETMPLGNGAFAVSWQESNGATVTNLQDFDRGVVHSFITLPDRTFLRMSGPMVVTQPADQPADDLPQRNKALVIEAMTALFQRRDSSAVERLYAADYVQHNPDIPQGREALKDIVAGLFSDIWYEPGMMIAEGDLVAIHGRITGWSLLPQVVIDLFRIENGKLAEHWDVLQDEVKAPPGGISMFDSNEGKR
jgi:predicted SnoaL-like aldol condensation-catalyzing enzyme